VTGPVGSDFPHSDQVDLAWMSNPNGVDEVLLESEDVLYGLSWETGMGHWNGDGLPKPDANEAVSIQDSLVLYSHSNPNDKCHQQMRSV